jgi:hypothetical protein
VNSDNIQESYINFSEKEEKNIEFFTNGLHEISNTVQKPQPSNQESSETDKK